MNYTIAQIEQAILSELSDLTVSKGGHVRTLESYQGQFNGPAAGKDQVLVLCPAILVSYIGSSYKPDGAPAFERVFKFALFHVSSNMESEKTRRQTVYDLLDSTKKNLVYQTLGLDIAPFIIERESVVDSVGALSVYCAEYSSSFQEDTSLYQP